MQVRSLGQKVPLEKEIRPTLVFSPENSHSERSLESYGPLGREKSDMTVATEQACMSII